VSLAALVLLLLSASPLTGCSKGTSAPDAPKTELVGNVTARADGFNARPGWAEPGQAWSRSGETLVVVGYAKVRGDQRQEMAFRVSDSYARAELLRFLTSRVVAVLTDEEASGGGGLSEEERRVLEERITAQSEAVIDQWFVSARYWERRQEGKTESLHVFSRLEVDRTRLEELLQKSAGDLPDLRLSGPELSNRLAARWSRIAEVTELNEAGGALLEGVSAPDWAASGDREAEAGFTFVCQARAKDERTAEALARARCNEKLCQLFGVQIIARTSVKENLEELKAESEVTEQCADVRATGRKTTHRSSECTEDGCVHWLEQTYPRAAYRAELERQKEPTIIRQEVVVQEGDVLYRDPSACEESLRKYGAVEHHKAKDYKERLEHLNAALKSCQGIDARDSGLFASLNLLLTNPLDDMVCVRGRGQAVRCPFVAVPVDFRERLLTERFLTTRIQIVRDLVRDAVFPLELQEMIETSKRAETEADFEKAVRRAIEMPFDDEPTAKSHTRSLHAILLGRLLRGTRPSATYRAYLLEQLKRPTISCNWVSGSGWHAEQVAGYLHDSDRNVDDQEYQALLTAFRRAPSGEMDRCVKHLIDAKQLPAATLRKRGRELVQLVVDGRLVLEPKSTKTPPGANADLFEAVVFAMDKEERLRLFLAHHERLVGDEGDIERIARKITLENFGGMAPGVYVKAQRTDAEKVRDCQSLASRYRAAASKAPELLVGNTDVCQCLRLSELNATTRKELVETWAAFTDKTCKYFEDEEWPGGHKVWPYEKRRFSSEKGTPFRRHASALRSEYSECSKQIAINGVRFSPTLWATLDGRVLRKTSVTVQVTGKLRDMHKKGDWESLVRVEDVERAQQAFEACFESKTEGYEVPADDIEKPPAGPRRVWLEIGDQGISHGYE